MYWGLILPTLSQRCMCIPLLGQCFEGMADHRVKGPEGPSCSASVYGFNVGGGGWSLLLFMALVPCTLFDSLSSCGNILKNFLPYCLSSWIEFQALLRPWATGVAHPFHFCLPSRFSLWIHYWTWWGSRGGGFTRGWSLIIRGHELRGFIQC